MKNSDKYIRNFVSCYTNAVSDDICWTENLTEASFIENLYSIIADNLDREITCEEKQLVMDAYRGTSKRIGWDTVSKKKCFVMNKNG